MTQLTAALGRYPHTAGLFAVPGELDLQDIPVISRAFAPMVRKQAFDVSEMAIATFLMARAAGSDLVLLPVTMAARFQNGAMLRRAEDSFGPRGLVGRRIGVRAYSQTTGMWLRGVLEDEGVAPDAAHWITLEDAHVEGFQDPAWCERAQPGASLEAMLRTGAIDAAIFGAETPDDPDFAPVFPNPRAAFDQFWQRYGFVPVNHMVVVRLEVARRPGVVRTLLDRFRATRGLAAFPYGKAALEPALRTAVRFSVRQGLLPRALTMAEIWAGLPSGCGE